jgi:hypothetical protein
MLEEDWWKRGGVEPILAVALGTSLHCDYLKLRCGRRCVSVLCHGSARMKAMMSASP